MALQDRRRKRSSIALPIFALTIISVVLTAILLFAVTFRGPPPRAAPVRLEIVADALRTGMAPAITDQMMMIGEGGQPSGLPPSAGRVRAAEASLARMLRVSAGAVHVTAFEAQPDPFTIRGPFSAGVSRDGRWRVLSTSPPRLFSRWHWWTLQAMMIACAVLGVAAWLIARAITRPLRQLAQSAAQGRVGRSIALPTGGPREVQELGDALSAMHGRLARHAESRMAMLAAIAHDLGTPLSRIAFWIERLPDDARVRASADLDEMRTMLGDVLRFARDERMGETTRVDLGSVLDALVDDLAVAGQPVSLNPGERVVIRGNAAALRRLFANLIENAVRYGDTAEVAYEIEHADVRVTVTDEGPGFDSDRDDRLFEPFVRGDPSRNRATGGTGLGLAIVRSIAEAHGGSVTLGTASHRGGCVSVRLPLA